MTHEDLTTAVMVANAVFTACRIVAHVPQFIAVLNDRCGAKAISLSSWILFTLANASNAAYALVMAADWTMFLINAISAASCLSIAIAAAIKQRAFRKMSTATGQEPLDPSVLLGSTSLRRPIA